jgi:hypothetical protein
VLAIPAAQRTPGQQRELFGAFRLADPLFAELNQQISAVWTNWPYPPTTLVFQPRAAPRATHLFKRGDRLRPGEIVQPDVPAVLNPFPAGAPRNRLGLARWMVDGQHPDARGGKSLVAGVFRSGW